MAEATSPSTFATPPAPAARADTRWALMFGNFVIGCGVMAVGGSLNELAASLEVSVAVAGQLIATGAAALCFGAPLLAGLVAGWDRRKLLALTMLWYAAGHAVCALAPNYAALLPIRTITLIAAAIFTPQAAAAVGVMSSGADRARAITFVLLGWSLASVLGMPAAAWISGHFGWRATMVAVGLLSLVCAAWVWRAMPEGVKPQPLTLRAWRGVLSNRELMAVVWVTALQAAGQFTVFSYVAPYYREVLKATPTEMALLFGWFGAVGLVGQIALTRLVDRHGPARLAGVGIVLIGVSLLLWTWAATPLVMAAVITPWALACFATNSVQQARLGVAAPALAPALMALNTSAIYLGQAVGAASGGWLIAQSGYAPLHWAGLAWLALGLALSGWARRRGL